MTDLPALAERIKEYLTGGGLFNPELADHMAVRDLLLECRDALREAHELERERDNISLKALQDYREYVAEVERLKSLLREAREGVDLIGCSQEGYDALMDYRDKLLVRIDAELGLGDKP